MGQPEKTDHLMSRASFLYIQEDERQGLMPVVLLMQKGNSSGKRSKRSSQGWGESAGGRSAKLLQCHQHAPQRLDLCGRRPKQVINPPP